MSRSRSRSPSSPRKEEEHEEEDVSVSDVVVDGVVLPPEELIQRRRSWVPPRIVGEHVFLECSRAPYRGSAYILEKPIILCLDPCVFVEGELAGHMHVRRITKENRRYINDLWNELISEVDTFSAKKAQVWHPLRWQFWVWCAKDMERIKPENCLTYWSQHKKPKLCYWAKLTMRFHGLQCLDNDDDSEKRRQYFLLMDVVRLEELDKL